MGLGGMSAFPNDTAADVVFRQRSGLSDSVAPGALAVLGVGNALCGDDGVGIHALHYLDEHALAPEAALIDGGTIGFQLLHRIEDAGGIVVIDAARLDRPPGSFVVLAGDEMDRFLADTARGSSVHEISLLDLLTVARLHDTLPARRALIAVQPADTGWNASPSPPVHSALPAIAAAVQELLEDWQP